MKILPGGLENIPGFTFSAIECGIKYQNRLDFSLIFSEKPCNAAGMFTTNKVFAAPVRLCRERIAGPVHGIMINANNANACTGDEGYRNIEAITGRAAHLLKVSPLSILAASTGVIGVQLPVGKMVNAVPDLVNKLSPGNGTLIPRAIMTTDTVPKAAAASISCSAGEFTIAGTAKGVGMIAPNMATLLAFIITDMPLDRGVLNEVFRRCVGKSFNSITIDGDMSTNDTAIILSPASEAPVKESGDIALFEEALLYVLETLAKMLVADGEGASKFVTITVTGAGNDTDAGAAARAISQSLLVKTALFGNDPNWGRVACAAGYSGAELDQDRLSIAINGVALFHRGVTAEYDRAALIEKLSGKEIDISVDLGLGSGRSTFYTCDISYDYVKINAEYTT